MPWLTFKDLDARVRGEAGETLLDVCLEHDLPMETACGGFAACNSCRVRLVSGALTALDDLEAPFLDRPDQRLGCLARLTDADVSCTMDPGDSYS